MRSLEVTVSPDGEVEIRAVGFKGKACERASKALEEAMGIVNKKTKTPDYYVEEATTQKVGGS